MAIERALVKIIKTLIFCATCLLVFLLAGAATCTLRARYGVVPKLRARFAYMNLANLHVYSFLEYNQANPEQGKAALLLYLDVLKRIEKDGAVLPETTLHFESALTYLRLYRLESAAGNSAAADDYMRSAQKENLALGWKEADVSTEALARNIATRETNEAKLYNSNDAKSSGSEPKPCRSKEATK
jgi:hypothetical protein